jgi:tetratricopeptide (TPR) repeat protein
VKVQLRGGRAFFLNKPLEKEEGAMVRIKRFRVLSVIGCFVMASRINMAQVSIADYAASYVKRGNDAYADGKLEKAIVEYGIAISIHPKSAVAYYNRGCARQDMGDFHGAVADYNLAIELNPRYAAAYSNRGK